MSHCYDKIIFVNFRHRQEGDMYVCWLPVHELFIAKGLEENGVARCVEIYTVYSHEDPEDYFGKWKDADLLVFWDTYARSARYVTRYFDLAGRVRETLGLPVVFGGYWPTSYGEHYSEFQVFDAIIRGYAIDGVVKILQGGVEAGGVYEAFGPSAYDKYELDLGYIRTDLDRYVVFDTVQGYFSSFGCPKRCSFCINDLYRRLGTTFCPRKEAQVKRDIDALFGAIDCSAINFKDSNFFYDLDRAKHCLEYVRDKGKEVNYNLDVTVRDADDRFFERMADMGADKHFFFGLESAFPEEREIFGKPYSDEELEAFLKRAHRHGFNVSGNLMFGFPFQTTETILEQVDWAINAMDRHPNLRINVSAYIPKSGTAMQLDHFGDLHGRLTFAQLVTIYLSDVEDLQSLIYGDRFREINFSMLKKGFAVLLAIRTLKQHLPPLANAVLETVARGVRRHVRKGAVNPLANAVLRRINVTRTRRVLTRAGIRYRKLVNRLARTGSGTEGGRIHES